MKFLYLLFLLSLVYCNISAQAVYQMVIYNERPEPGLMLLLPNKPDVVQNTILQKLEEIGYEPETKGSLFWKSDKINGFYIFKQVKLRDINNQTVDLYFKVENQTNNRRKSTLYMLISKGYDNFVSPQSDTAVYRAARRFLNGFVNETAAYKLNILIEEQKENLDDSQKKMKDLKEDSEKMQKNIEELKNDVIKNREEQEALESKIQQQQSLLDESNAKLNKLKK